MQKNKSELVRSRSRSNRVTERRPLLQSKVQSCDHCRDLFSSAGSLQASSPGRHKTSAEPLDEEKDELKGQLRQLELELAQTKLQLVEAKCRIQVRL